MNPSFNTAHTTPAVAVSPRTSGGSGAGGGGGGGGSFGGATASTPTYTYNVPIPFSAGEPAATPPSTSTPKTTSSAPVNTNQMILDVASRQAQIIQDQVNKLASQDKTSASSVVVSDAPVVDQEKNALNIVNEKSKVSRDLSYLDNEIRALEANLQNEINAINQGFDSLKVDQGDQQKRETGQTSVGLATAGGFLGFSGSGTGVLLNLAKSHRAEMRALEAKRQQAIQDARTAAAQRRFDVVKLKAQEIADVEQEQYNRDQDYFSNQLALQQEERISTQARLDQTRQEMEDARGTIETLLTTFGSLKKEDLTPDYRTQLEDMARKARIPVDQLYKQLGTEPSVALSDKEKTERVNLTIDASRGGAPASVVQAISTASTFADAATLAQPYIRKQTGTAGTTFKKQTSGGLVYTSETIAQGEAVLRGSGGGTYFADPASYDALFDTWTNEQGLEEDFFDVYPIDRWVSPEQVPNLSPALQTAYSQLTADDEDLSVPF